MFVVYRTQHLLNYSRDHTVRESLDYAITWNAAMLQTKDMVLAGAALMTKDTPTFDNLPKAEDSMELEAVKKSRL